MHECSFLLSCSYSRAKYGISYYNYTTNLAHGYIGPIKFKHKHFLTKIAIYQYLHSTFEMLMQSTTGVREGRINLSKANKILSGVLSG